jgi:hypothetical protein
LYKQDAHDKSPRTGFRSAFLSSYHGSARLIPTFVVRVKQSQFADRDRKGRRPTKSSAGPLVGPIAPNKPNLPQTHRKRRRSAGLEELPPVGPVAQTNPTCHRGQGRPSPRPEALTLPPVGGHVRQTKPICRRREEWGEARQRRPGRRRWVRACETKPISPERSEGASTAREESYDELDLPRASEKQSQFADTDSRWTRAGEVTSGALARAHCAKQTQSAPRRPEKAPAARAAIGGIELYKQSQFAGGGKNGARPGNVAQGGTAG